MSWRNVYWKNTENGGWETKQTFGFTQMYKDSPPQGTVDSGASSTRACAREVRIIVRPVSHHGPAATKALISHSNCESSSLAQNDCRR
ncbi:hypothetical protein FGB62_67g012 [Gracilaria domingensis]|nr:hypothetical protein FGB62_67g012 [Gracilaria domingensis]